MAPKPTLYHASPVRFRHGDLIVGGRGGGSGYAHPNVCMTTSPLAHATINNNIPGWRGHHVNPDPNSLYSKPPVVDRDWFVYEVEPIGPLHYVEGNEEYQARSAKVIRNLGKASAFLQKAFKWKNVPVWENEPDGETYLKRNYLPAEVAKSREVERDRQEKALKRKQRHLEKWDLKNDVWDEKEASIRVTNRFLKNFP